jgi:hypothetical protein
MPKLPVDDVGGIHELLLNPTAENVLKVTCRLESLAGEVARMQSSIMVGEPSPEAVMQFLFTVREETFRVRELLDNAARFYNALNAQTEGSGYERHGFVRKSESPRRPLARL